MTPDPGTAPVGSEPAEAAPGRRWFSMSLVLIAAGAGLLLVAGGRAWSTTTIGGGALPTVTVVLTGADLTPSSAVAVLALAGLAGLAATRRRGRLVIGVLLVLAGAAIVDTALVFATSWSSATGSGATIRSLALEKVGADGPTSTTVTAWWVVTLAAGLLVAAGGVPALLTSRTWPAMGRRYERSLGADRQARDVRPRSAWDQLDAGIDPTEEPPPAGPVDTTADPTLGVGGEA